MAETVVSATTLVVVAFDMRKVDASSRRHLTCCILCRRETQKMSVSVIDGIGFLLSCRTHAVYTSGMVEAVVPVSTVVVNCS